MREGFVKQLDKFNKERVFPAWDALVHRQQAKLETLGVPTMYRTDSGADRHVSSYKTMFVNLLNHLIRIVQRQQRIVQILEGVTGGQDPEEAYME